MAKKKNYFKLFKDILKENGNKYSQGRFYLLLSAFAYYITLAILTVKGINKGNEIDLDSFKIIIDALQYALILFAGYVFGGKIATTVKDIKGVKPEPIPEEEME